jgi:serine/threonine-protein kinase
MAESAVSAGHVLLGRYRLDVKLGQGGMGTIWRAQHLVLNAPVAVKVIDRTVIPDEETLSRFMREAQSAAALRSPHVVQILDYGIDGKVPFMAMELLEGENLAQRIKRNKRLTPQDTARVLSHIGRAISRAHDAGIVHRDLKPENVFLVKNEDEEIAKVLDFGVAKVERHALEEGTRTRTGSILGTPFYMSPEQAQGNRTVDSRTDLWAMGVIAFECLTGKRPFYSDGLGDLVLAICVRDIPQPSSIASVPIGFDAWWNRAVARDPEKRFQTAKELTDALRDALGLEPRDLIRESPHASPDIQVTSAPGTDRDTPPTDPMLGGLTGSAPAASPPISVRADELAEPHAATVVAPMPGEAPAFTVRQFSTTQKSPPSAPPRSDGAGLVIGVAAAALFVGLIAGVMLLRSHNEAEQDQHRALPAPLPDPGRQASEPRVKGKAAAQPSAAPVAAPSASEKKPLLEFLPSDATSEPAATATPTPTPSTPPGEQRAAPKQEAPAASASAAPHPASSSNLPDGGWVKPEWAIPDGDPVRRAPINE